MSLFARRRKSNRRVRPAVPRRPFPLRGLILVIAFMGGMSGLSWGAVRLADPAIMPVKYVRVSGDLRHLTPDAIRDRVRAALKGNFLTADTNGVRRSVAALAWVKDVSVARAWPDTLNVAVVERRALGRWAGGGLISDAGHLFNPPAAAASGAALPLLEGPDEDAATVVRNYHAAAAALASLHLEVRHMAVDGRHAWRMDLANGIAVVLGRDDFARRLAQLARVYPRVLAPHADRIERVDMRYSNGFAVRWRDTPSA